MLTNFFFCLIHHQNVIPDIPIVNPPSALSPLLKKVGSQLWPASNIYLLLHSLPDTKLLRTGKRESDKAIAEGEKEWKDCSVSLWVLLKRLKRLKSQTTAISRTQIQYVKANTLFSSFNTTPRHTIYCDSTIKKYFYIAPVIIKL